MSNGRENLGSNRIVVGVDGSEPSQHALRWAAALSRATGAGLCAVAAWQPYTAYGWMGAGWAAMPADWDPAADAEAALTKTVGAVFGEDRPEDLELLVLEGGPAATLLEVSKHATMLVVGSRGHGGFAGLLLGSVSSACAEHAECPVLVLHGDSPAPVPMVSRG